MNIIVIIVIAVIGFILWQFIGFSKYKRLEAQDKQKVMHYIQSGLNLSEAIEKVFLDLSICMPSKLNPETISTVSQKLAALQSMMSVDNVIEIYSTFIYRYICRNSSNPHSNVKDEQVLYAAESMEFDQLNGYFTLRADKGNDFSNKYPPV